MKKHLMRLFAVASLLACGSALADVPTGPYAVRIVSNVTYGPAPVAGSEAQGWESSNTLYECLPQPTAGRWGGPFPVVIFVHGGAWDSGHAGYDLSQCKRWAEYGFAAFSINYRLQSNRFFHGYPSPAQLVDVQLAFRWVRAHGAALNLSGAQSTCFGDSAGASLCEQVAFYPGEYPSPNDPATALYPQYLSHANSFVAEFGPSLFGPAPLTAPLAAERAPTSAAGVLVQGSEDTIVPPANSRAVYTPLYDDGRPILYIPFVGGHEFSGASNATISTIKTDEMRFIANHVRYFGFRVSQP